MVIVHMSVDFQGLQDFIQLSGVGDGYVQGMSGVHHIFDVLVIDGYFASGYEIPFHNHGDFGIQHSASGQSAPNGVIYL